MEIRNFVKQDWKNFSKLRNEAFPLENSEQDIFQQYLEREGFIGAFVKDTLIGFLNLSLMGDYAHIHQIAVKKSERGKGYGKQLMEEE